VSAQLCLADARRYFRRQIDERAQAQAGARDGADQYCIIDNNSALGFHVERSTVARGVTTERSRTDDTAADADFIAADGDTPAGRAAVAACVLVCLVGIDSMVSDVGGFSAPGGASTASNYAPRSADRDLPPAIGSADWRCVFSAILQCCRVDRIRIGARHLAWIVAEQAGL
jgi:hypothetical protein